MNDTQAKSEFSNALLTLVDQMSPLLDAADGMRADMERRGWSPTAAEHVVMQWLANAQTFIWQNAK